MHIVNSFFHPLKITAAVGLASRSARESLIITLTSRTQQFRMSSTTESGAYSRPRKFAPLNPSKVSLGASKNLPVLKGIIFDVDGTLCLPQNYMFREMRAALDIDKSTDILDHINTLSDTPEIPGDDTSSPKSIAMEKIRDIERTAMTDQRPQPGLLELMNYLESRNVPKALCTRNFPAPVHHLIDTFLSGMNRGFDVIITRDDKDIKPKPSPEGLWKIAKYWRLDQQAIKQLKDDEANDINDNEHDVLELAKRNLGSGLIMVGDSIDDMAAGYRAGAATVLLENDENQALSKHEYTDVSVRRLDELIEILEEGFVGK